MKKNAKLLASVSFLAFSLLCMNVILVSTAYASTNPDLNPELSLSPISDINPIANSVSSYVTSDINLILNPGFENGSKTHDNWTIISLNGNSPIWDTLSHNGSRSTKINVPGTTAVPSSGYVTSSYITASPLTKYNFSAWGKTSGIKGDAVVYVVETDVNSNWTNEHGIVFRKGTGDWEKKEISFITSSNTTSIHVVAEIEYGYGMFWVDDIELKMVVPTSLPTDTPDIMSFAPLSSILRDYTGAKRSFNISIDQAVDVNWYINGTLVQSNESVTEAMFTYTNASEGTSIVNATATNTNGVVSRDWTWSMINTISPSDTSAINLILNPGFENGSTTHDNWTILSVNGNKPIWDTVSHNSSRSLKISVPRTTTVPSSGYATSSFVAASPLKLYNLSAWGKTSDIEGDAVVYVVEADAYSNWTNEHGIVFRKRTKDWEKKEISFTTSSSTTSLHIVAKIEYGYGMFWVDDVELKMFVPPYLPTGTPDIMSYTPLSSTVSDHTGASRSFNINIDQTVDVNWYVNGALVQSNESVTKAMFTNANASEGTWIVNATATNANGMVSREWTWSMINAPSRSYTSPFNPILNPGFENGSRTHDNWTIFPINGNSPIWDTLSHNGSRSIKISVPGTTTVPSTGYARSSYVAATPSEQYNFSAWGKTSDIEGDAVVYIVEADVNSNWITDHGIVFSKGTENWTIKEISFRTRSNTKSLYVVTKIEAGYGTFWVDDVLLKPTTTHEQTQEQTQEKTQEKTPGTKTSKVEIGNWGYGSYGYLSFQDDPRLTWDEVVSPNNIRPDVTNIWQQPIYSDPIPQTNFNFVQSRFDLATKNKDKNWDYGTYLLLEELFHPSVRAQWLTSTEGLNSWDIDGSATFAGVNIMHIKPWYTAKYGAWNQAWWDRVKAGNEYNNSIVWEWSVYYGYNLHKAWHLHMRSLGKKSAIVGIIGLGGMGLFETFTYPSPMWQYVTANYDLIFTYQYPTCVSSGCSRPISKSVDQVKQLREKYNYKGKLVHILTSLWPNGDGTDNEIVQFEEFKSVSPYVDVIVGMPYANVQVNPPQISYPSRLIKFYDSVNS